MQTLDKIFRLVIMNIMEKMEYVKIPLLGKHGEGKFTLVDGDYDGEWFSTMRLWFNPRTGYVVTKLHGKPVPLHKLVCKVPNGKWADHKNRDKLDNRSCNLRPVTPSENRLNAKDRLNPDGSEKARQTEEERKAIINARISTPEYKSYKREYDRERYRKKKLAYVAVM